MTKEGRNPKPKYFIQSLSIFFRHSSFDIHSSFDFSHSSFLTAMSPRLFIVLAPFLLTQCVDQYGNPMSPFGPQPPPPYTDQREQYRNQSREDAQQQNQLAYERGITDARSDSASGLLKSYNRHYQSYSPATQAAYQAGYDQGYTPALAPLPGTQPWQPQLQQPSYPGTGNYTPPPANDPAYSQGYDYGVRDRVAGRANDPGAHVGRYDPRYRRSFERGYSDAFSSRQ